MKTGAVSDDTITVMKKGAKLMPPYQATPHHTNNKYKSKVK
jgi:hypothetical protein